MASLELHTFVRAKPQRVWQVLSDLSGQASWMADVRRLEITSEAREGAGVVMKVTSELFGLPILHDVMEITGWQPEKRIDVLHRGQYSGTGSFILQSAAGGTIFTWREEFKPPLGPLGELAFAVAVKPHLQRVFGRSMDNVRRLAEAI